MKYVWNKYFENVAVFKVLRNKKIYLTYLIYQNNKINYDKMYFPKWNRF